MKKKYLNIHQELIEKCLEGDTRAQFELYKLYYKAMYNTSLRIVNNTAEAEDIMQEAFLNAFTRLETYSGTVSFGAWLKQIVVNKSLDFLRKRKIDFEDLHENESVETIDYEVKTDNWTAQQLDLVKKAISQLPDGYRVVLNLYLFEGYDHQEISQILGIKESASRSQFTRAKKKLNQLIENLLKNQ